MLSRVVLALLLVAFLSGCGSGSATSAHVASPAPDPSPSETSTPPLDWGALELKVLGAADGVLNDFTGCVSSADEPRHNLVEGAFLIASGGRPDPHYQWSVSSGSLPEGTTVDRDTGLFHKVAGATVVPGQYDFEMEATDGTNTAQGAYVVTIADNTRDGACDGGVFAYRGDDDLPTAYTHQSYAISLGFGVTVGSLDGEGGVPPFRFRVGDGYLPPGLFLDPRSGVLSGKVRGSHEGELFQFTLEVEDATGTEAAGRSPTFTILVL